MAIVWLLIGGIVLSLPVIAAAYLLQPADRAMPPPFPAALGVELRREIDRWSTVPGHYGVSASVVLADGARWTGAAGHAGRDARLTPDDLIVIASITKTMTAAIVLQLVDEGVLRLDDPIGRWLPDRPGVDPAIAVRQLLNHTAGLSNYTASAELSRAIAEDSSHVFTPDELLAFIGPPRFAPGAETEYTNTSFLLLGQIAERATGRSIVDLYRQRLWSPLGLTDIFLPGLEEPPCPVAPVLHGSVAVDPLERMSLLSIGHSAFGLYANAATVARWGRALFAGAVIAPAMQAEMRTLVAAAGNIQGETGAGLGIRGYRYLDREQLGHSGGAELGSSLLLYDLETGVTVVVLMNQGRNADHFLLAPRLLALATR